MSRSITTLEKALSLAAVTISAFESCLRASTSLHSSILRQARSTRNCCSMVRGISEVDMATTPFARGNLASATPQPWTLRPKKNKKIGVFCSIPHQKTELRSLTRSAHATRGLEKRTSAHQQRVDHQETNQDSFLKTRKMLIHRTRC